MEINSKVKDMIFEGEFNRDFFLRTLWEDVFKFADDSDTFNFSAALGEILHNTAAALRKTGIDFSFEVGDYEPEYFNRIFPYLSKEIKSACEEVNGFVLRYRGEPVGVIIDSRYHALNNIFTDTVIPYGTKMRIYEHAAHVAMEILMSACETRTADIENSINTLPDTVQGEGAGEQK